MLDLLFRATFLSRGISIGELISMFFLSAISRIDFFCDKSLLLSMSIESSLFSSCNSFAILNKSLSFYTCRLWWTTAARITRELLLKSTATTAKSTSKSSKHVSVHSSKVAKVAKSTSESTPKSTSKSSKALIIVITKWILPLLLFSFLACFLFATSESTESEEIIFIIKEICKWVFSSKEIFEDVLCMLECVEISMIETSKWPSCRPSHAS